jgi:hypothetical protein
VIGCGRLGLGRRVTNRIAQGRLDILHEQFFSRYPVVGATWHWAASAILAGNSWWVAVTVVPANSQR